jgi:hypothetical protein
MSANDKKTFGLKAKSLQNIRLLNFRHIVIKNLSHVAERAIFNVSSAVGNSNFTKEELERVVKEYSGKKE